MSNPLQLVNVLPQKFIQRLQKIIPAKFLPQYLQSFLNKAKTSFRVNTLKISVQQLSDLLTDQGFLLQPLTWHADVFTVPDEQRRKLTETTEWESGFFYVQNPSSIIPVLLLEPQPGEDILDLAAAPGGKTINLAIEMQNHGKIAAVEAVKSRFFKLNQNLKNYGVNIARTFLKDGSLVYRNCPEKFDRVLLDAPCSSEARFNIQDPESYAYWSEKKITEMTRKQKKLLYSAFQSLKPGGTLVYSTCSFAPEENEMMIQHLLEKFPSAIEIAKCDLPFTNFQPGLKEWAGKRFSPQLQYAIRIIPTDIMDGFFVCKLTKLMSTLK